MNLEPSFKIKLTNVQTRTSKWASIIFLVVAVAGFIDAAYLTAFHYLGEVPPCSIVEGCEEVTTSRFSTLFGIPISLFGALYYLFFIGLALAYIDTKNEKILFFASYASISGFLVSLFLLYLQVFVIKALCLYCIFSVATSTLLFLIGVYVLLLRYKKLYNTNDANFIRTSRTRI